MLEFSTKYLRRQLQTLEGTARAMSNGAHRLGLSRLLSTSVCFHLLAYIYQLLMGGSAVSSGTDLSADVYEPGTDVDLLETQAKLQLAVQTLIAGIGEDLQRDGLRDTPR